jgi:hypothetical protein
MKIEKYRMDSGAEDRSIWNMYGGGGGDGWGFYQNGMCL